MTNRVDNFTRSNSLVTMDPPSDGGSGWTVQTATAVWGIDTNQGYSVVSPAQSTVVLESSVSDVDVQSTFPAVGTNSEVGLIARSTDDSNYVLGLGNAGSGFVIYTREANNFNVKGSAAGQFANGDVGKLTVNGTALTLYQNGTLKVSGTSNFNQTATKHGIRTNSNTAARFTVFSITGLGGGASIVPILDKQYRQRWS